MSNVQSNKKRIAQVLHRMVELYVEELDDAESDEQINALSMHARFQDFGTYMRHVQTLMSRELQLRIHGTQSARPVLRYIGLSDDEWALVVENVQNMNEQDYDMIQHIEPEQDAEQALLRVVEVNQIIDRMNSQR